MTVRLIVGLGNPGARYTATRHNAGFCFVAWLARRCGVSFSKSTRFNASIGRGTVGGFDVRMLMPHTYMNRSGEAVAPFARYFRIEPGEILVAHDEVAFPPGVVRLKVGGGTNGHNGLRSIISTLGSPAFARLRIGVGHPGDPERMLGYLTTAAMPRAEQVQIDAACRLQDDLLKTLMRAEWQAAMNRLHRPRQPEG